MMQAVRNGAEPPADAIAVGLGELAVARASAPRCLVAHGLGSCVAMCLYDPLSGVFGLAHIVLPGRDPNDQPNAKFAMSALPALHSAMMEVGAVVDMRRYHARLAGGAHVLAIGGGGSLPPIGEKNVHAVRAALGEAAISIVGEHVGGGRGRTVWFDPREGGRIRVRTVGGEECVV